MVTYQRPKNLKWRVICAGVQRLLEQEGLKEEEVSLWVDWQSIYQSIYQSITLRNAVKSGTTVGHALERRSLHHRANCGCG